MRYYTGTNWLIIITYTVFKSCKIYLFPTSSLAVGCLEDMSPFAASNFDSPLAVAAQTEEARNGSEWQYEWHFLHEFWQRSVATWKHVNHWCSLPIFLQVKKFVLVSQMPFLQGADGPALRIKGRAGNQSGDRGSSGHSCFVCLTIILVLSEYGL